MHPKANTGRRLTKGKCRYSPGAAAPVAPCPPPCATAQGGGGAKKTQAATRGAAVEPEDSRALTKKIETDRMERTENLRAYDE